MAYFYTIIASTVIAILGWAMGINPRLSVIETRLADQKELIESKLESIDRRLERIERSLNGALKHD